MKEAIILAGGFGTRLRGVLADLPKPMAPINQHPFLSYLFDYLMRYHYDHVVLSTGYLHEKVEQFFGNQYKSVQISYAQEVEPLGTGGALQWALSFTHSENVLVLNGDTFFDVDLDEFEQFFQKSGSLLSLVLREVEDVQRYGSVRLRPDFRIASFAEKGAAVGRGLINGGTYFVKKSIFAKYPQPKKFSFEKDFMEQWYAREPIYGMVSDAYFIDIGVPEDYRRAQQEFLLKF